MIDNLFDVDCDNVHMVKVDSFEAAEPPAVVNPIVPASKNQLNFLKSLFAERQNNETAMTIRGHLLSEYKAGKLSVNMASEAISEILEIPKDQQKLPDVQPTVGEGFWVNPETNDVYKVQRAVHGSGALYAKKLMGESWEYVGRKPLYERLLPLTKETAAAYGHLYGRCMICGRTLTDEESIEAGIGPICNGKMGW